MKKIALLLCCVLSLFTLQTAYAEESIQGKEYPDRVNGVYDQSITNADVESYLTSLKEAVKKNDVDAVAKLINYPCNVNHRGMKQTLKNKAQFKKIYARLFTKDLKKLIASTTTDDLFVNYQGFMMGNGQIWFDPKTGIISFN